MRSLAFHLLSMIIAIDGPRVLPRYGGDGRCSGVPVGVILIASPVRGLRMLPQDMIAASRVASKSLRGTLHLKRIKTSTTIFVHDRLRRSELVWGRGKEGGGWGVGVGEWTKYT